MLRCAVILAEDDNGTILATCPDVPEAATFGEDREDASLRAVDAIETAIQGRIADRESFFPPSAGVAGTDSHGRMDQPKETLTSKG